MLYIIINGDRANRRFRRCAFAFALRPRAAGGVFWYGSATRVKFSRPMQLMRRWRSDRTRRRVRPALYDVYCDRTPMRNHDTRKAKGCHLRVVFEEKKPVDHHPAKFRSFNLIFFFFRGINTTSCIITTGYKGYYIFLGGRLRG